MIENLQRTDLNLVESEGYRTMMNVFAYTRETLNTTWQKQKSHSERITHTEFIKV